MYFLGTNDIFLIFLSALVHREIVKHNSNTEEVIQGLESEILKAIHVELDNKKSGTIDLFTFTRKVRHQDVSWICNEITTIMLFL